MQDTIPVKYNTNRFRSSLEAWGKDLRFWMRFPTRQGEVVTVKTAVSAVSSDGAKLNMQELEVIARYQLPVKIFVSDNAGYSMIYGSQNGNFHRLTGCNKESGLTLPNMENIAKAFGIKAMSILNEENLKEKIAEVLRSDEPVVCRVNTDIQQKILPRQCNYMREDGQMASRPLYDMTPLIEGLEI